MRSRGCQYRRSVGNRRCGQQAEYLLEMGTPAGSAYAGGWDVCAGHLNAQVEQLLWRMLGHHQRGQIADASYRVAIWSVGDEGRERMIASIRLRSAA